MKVIYFFFILLSLSCQDRKEVLIYKQWHLSAAQDTSDIDKSKSIPQFENQKAIYLDLKEKIKTKKIDALILEGCEGDVLEAYKVKFNGWNLEKIQSHKNKLDDIMAPIGMKLVVEFPNFPIYCGDQEKLMQQNLLALSNVRAFAGFYIRFKEYSKTSPLKFKAYQKQLEDAVSKKIDDPIQFSKEKALEALKQFKHFIYERNFSFVKNAQKLKYKNIAIVIGGLHVADMLEKFKPLEASVIVPKGYNEADEQLLDLIEKQIGKKEVHLFQLPKNFALKSFPLDRKIKIDFLTKNESDTLIKITQEFGIDKNIIFSDFDQDNIRDFTLSTHDDLLVISAEDDDWDNDGIPNILDETVGDIVIQKIEEVTILNEWRSLAKTSDIVAEIEKRNIKILGENELLVLEVFLKFIQNFELPTSNIKFIKASKETHTNKGRNTFFSYVMQSQSLEYYPIQLKKFVSSIYEKNFKDVNQDIFIQEYIIRLLVHSIAHEIFHSLASNVSQDLSVKYGWSFDIQKISGKYLNQARLDRKKMESVKINTMFRNKNYESWLNDYQKMNDPSFIVNKNIPSLYALSNPDEFLAEVFSLCIFGKVYPKSISKEKSLGLAIMLGINPSYATPEHCQQLRKFK